MRYQSTKGNWRKAVDAAEGLIVAAGGDGTVAKVFRQAAGRDVAVAVLALGTANNLARSLGLLGDARELIAGWDRGAKGTFDVCTMRVIGNRRERRFVESCGGGLLVEAIKRGPGEVEQPGKLVGSEMDRALTMAREIVNDTPAAHWHVEVDGEDVSGDYLAVEAMNIRLSGPGLPLAPDAIANDGKLDVVLVAENDRAALAEYLARRLSQDEHDLPRLRTVRGRHVLLGPPSGTLRIDDDLVKVAKPVELDVLKEAVTYVRAVGD